MECMELDGEAHEKYREAGRILTTVLGEARERVAPEETLLSVAEFAEERIHEEGGRPAFPVNISLDEEASHATPGRDDETTFGESMVCLDVGVHVDGYIADAAVTVDLTDTPEMVEAAEAALDAAVDAVGPGVHTGDVGAAIGATVEEYGYNPVVNLSGHGLAHWDAHTDPQIPNRAVDSGVELQAGDVVAIEPFVTTGSGRVREGSTEEIYSVVEERSVRDRHARQLLEDVQEEYRRLPFAKRYFEGGRTDMSLRRLEQAGVLRSYPVLKEQDGELVSQAEHTVVVTEDGCEVTTAGLFA
jgi:methionyl aminopeptidase